MADRPGHGPRRQSNRVLTRKRAAAPRALLLCALLVGAAGCGSASAPAQRAAPALTPPVVRAPSPDAASSTPGSEGPSGSGENPAGLSDPQMVGQLFMAYVYGASATSATPAQRQANISLYGEPTGTEVVRRWHLGGLILLDHNSLDPARPNLSTGNVGTPTQITALTSGLQRAARADSGIPLLIATDQEGGRVQRITQGVSPRPTQLSLAHNTPQQLRCGYFHLGQQLRALGVTQDFAPDADVVRTRTGVIGDRSFGPDPALDARDVAAAVSGLQDAGVAATLKHWPGHGSTSTDSHAALAVITESATTWRAVDRAAFVPALRDAAAVMVGHLALPALDPSGQPASLSPALVNGQLRARMGYQGLVVTDSLWMEPVRAAGTPGDVALRALGAGDDVLLESPDVPAAFNAVLTRVRSDKHIHAEVTAAVRRIIFAKSVHTTATPASC